MQKISTFVYGIGQGLKNIFRNRMFSLASIATMAACLFLFGVCYSVIANFRSMISKAEQRVGITVFFDEGITDDEISAIGEKIRMRAEIAEIIFTSADQAWDEYKRDKLSPELVETFGDDNPLENSASYTVYLNDISMQDSLVRYIMEIEGVRKVNNKKDVSENLTGINKVLTVLAVAIIVILLGVTIFLISITISTGVSIRKQEISIMKLIGATNFFIRIPYIVEGMIIGIIGAIIPLVILNFSYGVIISALQDNFQLLLSGTEFVEGKDIMKVLIPVSLAIGIGIGFIGSNVTLGRQLRKIEVG
ncbi:MAG: permease-like cell division protein FtsX [Lachnospiraceae bacterium]|nr:permease-like cell division protein FtsX [Lachnospiraceae bacterium]